MAGYQIGALETQAPAVGWSQGQGRAWSWFIPSLPGTLGRQADADTSGNPKLGILQSINPQGPFSWEASGGYVLHAKGSEGALPFRLLGAQPRMFPVAWISWAAFSQALCGPLDSAESLFVLSDGRGHCAGEFAYIS